MIKKILIPIFILIILIVIILLFSMPKKEQVNEIIKAYTPMQMK